MSSYFRYRSYFGTDNADYLHSGNWSYAWKYIYAGAGNDTVITPFTGVDYYFSGGSGIDYFEGDSGNDTIYGGSDGDTLKGWSGDDLLVGDTGMDYLYGGTSTGEDIFRFEAGDTYSSMGRNDVIADWDATYDEIDMPLAGTVSNYRETSTSATNIESARAIVEGSASLREADHVFLYNGATDTGYLLSDLNSNYTFETGVIVRGAGEARNMAWSDII